jgi:REP element-mobilizing transposase RayT
VEAAINKIPDRFGVEIPRYMIMPNHIHLLVTVLESSPERAIHESPLRKRSVISQIVGYLKMNASKQIHSLNPLETVWQRSFHDHIIRNERDYERIWDYIDTNPLKWEDDCFYTP